MATYNDLYAWIYGLSELLALSGIGLAFLGYHWWRQRKANMRLRGERLALDAARAEALAFLDGAIVAAEADPTQQRTGRSLQADGLKTLRPLLEHEGFGGVELWKRAIGTLGAALGKSQRSMPIPAAPQDSASVPRLGGDGELDIDASMALDAEIDHLLVQNEQGLARLHASRGLAVELRRKCEDIRAAHQNLKASLENITRQDANAPLQHILDELGQSHQALLQTAFTAERQHGHMAAQLEALQQQVHNLQVTVKNYRQSLQQALSTRNELAEEKNELIQQLKAKNKLIERLNHSYDALRREYSKLYKVNRPPKA